METGFGLLSSWPWLKWRGSCSKGYAEVRGVVFFRRTCSRLLLERVLSNSWISQLEELFRKLKWLCETKIEKNRGLNRPLNDDWHFRSLRPFLNLKVISQPNSQLISQQQNWVLRMQNGTRVPRGCFAVAKIFTTWRLNLQNFALRILQLGSQLQNGLLKMRNGTRVPRGCFVAAKIFATWLFNLQIFSQVDPHFRNLIFQLAKFSQVKKIPLFFSFFGSLWLPSTSFEIPPDFDHSKSLSYIKIKTINKAFKSTKTCGPWLVFKKTKSI